MQVIPKEIKLGASNPFLLTKHDCVWIIASGEVEVYYVTLDEKGSLQSSRHFLYAAGKGEMLFSLKMSESSHGLTLMVISSNAKLIEIRKEYVANLDLTQLCYKVDQWILKLAESLQTNTPPRIYTNLEESDKVSIDEEQIAYPNRGLYWIKLKHGRLKVYGDEIENVKEIEKISLGIIPVSNKLWITAIGDDAEVEVLPTNEIVEDEISLMLSLHYLQRYFFIKIQQKLEAFNNFISVSLEKKVQRDHAMLESSLKGLKSIIAKDEYHESLSTNYGNLLLSTCQLIGAETGFEFNDPKFKEDKKLSTLNQLSGIAQVSNVRVRKVILRGEWWKEENGHLLAFTKKDKGPVALIQGKANSYRLKNVGTNQSIHVTQEIADTLEPIAYMFFYAFDSKMNSLKAIWEFAIKGLKRDAWYIVLAALGGSVIGLFIPILFGIMFDEVIPQADRDYLLTVFSLMLIVGSISALLQLIR